MEYFRASSSPLACSIHSRACAALTRCSAASTSSSNSVGSILTSGSFAATDPPLLKLGETQITRPVTSDTTVAFSSSLTAPVNLTVSD